MEHFGREQSLDKPTENKKNSFSNENRSTHVQIIVQFSFSFFSNFSACVVDEVFRWESEQILERRKSLFYRQIQIVEFTVAPEDHPFSVFGFVVGTRRFTTDLDHVKSVLSSFARTKDCWSREKLNFFARRKKISIDEPT